MGRRCERRPASRPRVKGHPTIMRTTNSKRLASDPELLARGLFAAAVLLSGALSWMSYRLHDPFATAFFFLLMVVLAVCSRILAATTAAPSNVVDLDARRRQLASIATSEYGRAARRG